MNDASKKSIASEKKLSEYERDPDFYKGESSFEFPNGDRYNGGFCAHRSGVVWREGLGTYTTKDGQVYKGMWIDDKLVEKEQVEISFTDDFQYFGGLSNNKMDGSALYSFHQNMHLLCSFSDNKPTGELLIMDKRGKEWRGRASETKALILPEHIYFKMIPGDYGKGKPREKPHERREQTVKTEDKPKRPSKDDAYTQRMRKLEMKIFAKTKKTISDLKFEQSAWYQNYENFKKTYREILRIVEDTGEESLSDSQKEWLRKYGEFKKRYLEIMDGRKYKEKRLSDYKLFELFNSDEYRNSCPPVSVYYPTKRSEEGFVSEHDECIDHNVSFYETSL